MNIGRNIKEIRKRRSLSQKEVAMQIGIDQAQYSRIESGKVEPTISSLGKIADALGVGITDFFKEEIPTEVSSSDKNLVEKIQLLEELEEQERSSILSIIDIAISRKRLRDTLNQAINLAS